MHFIATDREVWDINSFLESGRTSLKHIFDSLNISMEFAQGTALDLGCGIGRITFALADLFTEVKGIDVSERMVDQAKVLDEELGFTNVAFLCNDGHSLEMIESGSCQFVFSYIVLQHIPEPKVVLNYIREMARVVRPEGFVLFQVPIYTYSPWVKPWRIIQWLYRAVLRRLEEARLVPPERGVAFRGSRVSPSKLEETLNESGLVQLKSLRSESPYRFCDDVVMYCRKKQR